MEEREQFVSALESIRREPSLASLGWEQVVSQQGARLPAVGDSLRYPAGTALESLRQGLLTYNTYVSTLCFPAGMGPEAVDVWTESTESSGGSRRFFVGQWIDALDTVSKWLEATVIGVHQSEVFIHYNGWPRQWDEWIHVVGFVVVIDGRTRRVWLRSAHTRVTVACDHRCVLTWCRGLATRDRQVPTMWMRSCVE